MRKGRGLPKIVELLGLEEADNVVCGAAIALRNLALDKSNRVLIGKLMSLDIFNDINANIIEMCLLK